MIHQKLFRQNPDLQQALDDFREEHTTDQILRLSADAAKRPVGSPARARLQAEAKRFADDIRSRAERIGVDGEVLLQIALAVGQVPPGSRKPVEREARSRLVEQQAAAVDRATEAGRRLTQARLDLDAAIRAERRARWQAEAVNQAIGLFDAETL